MHLSSWQSHHKNSLLLEGVLFVLMRISLTWASPSINRAKWVRWSPAGAKETVHRQSPPLEGACVASSFCPSSLSYCLWHLTLFFVSLLRLGDSHQLEEHPRFEQLIALGAHLYTQGAVWRKELGGHRRGVGVREAVMLYPRQQESISQDLMTGAGPSKITGRQLSGLWKKKPGAASLTRH